MSDEQLQTNLKDHPQRSEKRYHVEHRDQPMTIVLNSGEAIHGIVTEVGKYTLTVMARENVGETTKVVEGQVALGPKFGPPSKALVYKHAIAYIRPLGESSGFFGR